MFSETEAEVDASFPPSVLKTIIGSGLNAVDVFFIMTGFLTLIPVILQIRRTNWYEFIAMRLIRIYPALIVTLIYFCGYLSNMGSLPLMSWEGHPSMGVRDILTKHNSPIGDGPHNACELSIYNLLFVNNFVPFGGCAGWTWSLSIQVQFFVIFLPLMSYFPPGRKFLMFFAACIVWIIIQRYLIFTYVIADYFPSPLYLYTADNLVPFFLMFNFWYANTFQRMIAIFYGVALGVVHISYPNIANYLRLRSSRYISYTLTTASLAVIYYMHVIELSKLGPIHMSLITVGGPLWLTAITYLMYDIIEKITIFGIFASKILSFKFWSHIATPSYGMYLIHSIFTIKFWEYYRIYVGPLFPISFTSPHYIGVTSAVFICSWIYGMVVYHLVEKNTIKLRKHVLTCCRRTFGGKITPPADSAPIVPAAIASSPTFDAGSDQVEVGSTHSNHGNSDNKITSSKPSQLASTTTFAKNVKKQIDLNNVPVVDDEYDGMSFADLVAKQEDAAKNLKLVAAAPLSFDLDDDDDNDNSYPDPATTPTNDLSQIRKRNKTANVLTYLESREFSSLNTLKSSHDELYDVSVSDANSDIIGLTGSRVNSNVSSFASSHDYSHDYSVSDSHDDTEPQHGTKINDQYISNLLNDE